VYQSRGKGWATGQAASIHEHNTLVSSGSSAAVNCALLLDLTSKSVEVRSDIGLNCMLETAYLV
jgi:hypothetical protein